MGWVFVNLVIPVTLPFAILLCLNLVDMPEPYASRGKLLRTVRDGQLGWISMSFSAACTYELWGYVFGSKAGAPDWTGAALAVTIVFMLFAGILSMAGTLFPFDESKPIPMNLREWLVYYRLLSGTAMATIFAATLYA